VTSGANNPYLPPKAPVADPRVPMSGARPRAINAALVLIAVRALLGIAVMFAYKLPASGSYLAMDLVVAATPIAVALTLGWFISRGRNWARIVYLVLTVISLMVVAFTLLAGFVQRAGVSMELHWSPWMLAMTLAPAALSIAVVVLLFGPGRAWFASRE
jgi:hypothetical protein